MKKNMEEKKKEKKESMFKFYAHGYNAGVKDLGDDYDQDEEEFNRRYHVRF